MEQNAYICDTGSALNSDAPVFLSEVDSERFDCKFLCGNPIKTGRACAKRPSQPDTDNPRCHLVPQICLREFFNQYLIIRLIENLDETDSNAHESLPKPSENDINSVVANIHTSEEKIIQSTTESTTVSTASTSLSTTQSSSTPSTTSTTSSTTSSTTISTTPSTTPSTTASTTPSTTISTTPSTTQSTTERTTSPSTTLVTTPTTSPSTTPSTTSATTTTESLTVFTTVPRANPITRFVPTTISTVINTSLQTTTRQGNSQVTTSTQSTIRSAAQFSEISARPTSAVDFQASGFRVPNSGFRPRALSRAEEEEEDGFGVVDSSLEEAGKSLPPLAPRTGQNELRHVQVQGFQQKQAQPFQQLLLNPLIASTFAPPVNSFFPTTSRSFPAASESFRPVVTTPRAPPLFSASINQQIIPEFPPRANKFIDEFNQPSTDRLIFSASTQASIEDTKTSKQPDAFVEAFRPVVSTPRVFPPSAIGPQSSIQEIRTNIPVLSPFNRLQPLLETRQNVVAPSVSPSSDNIRPKVQVPGPILPSNAFQSFLLSQIRPNPSAPESPPTFAPLLSKIHPEPSVRPSEFFQTTQLTIPPSTRAPILSAIVPTTDFATFRHPEVPFSSQNNAINSFGRIEGNLQQVAANTFQSENSLRPHHLIQKPTFQNFAANQRPTTPRAPPTFFRPISVTNPPLPHASTDSPRLVFESRFEPRPFDKSIETVPIPIRPRLIRVSTTTQPTFVPSVIASTSTQRSVHSTTPTTRFKFTTRLSHATSRIAPVQNLPSSTVRPVFVASNRPTIVIQRIAQTVTQPPRIETTHRPISSTSRIVPTQATSLDTRPPIFPSTQFPSQRQFFLFLQPNPDEKRPRLRENIIAATLRPKVTNINLQQQNFNVRSRFHDNSPTSISKEETMVHNADPDFNKMKESISRWNRIDLYGRESYSYQHEKVNNAKSPTKKFLKAFLENETEQTRRVHPIYEEAPSELQKKTSQVLRDCVDKESACSYWSTRGECQKNPRYMLDVCKASCHVCFVS